MFTHYLGRQQRTPEGRLTFGEFAARELVEKFGTPLYVIDERDFRDRIRAFRAAAMAQGPSSVAYAAKANSALAVLRVAREENLYVDAASLGELEAALRAGFEPERIRVHGNNKSAEELERSVEVGVGAIVLDNFEEIEALAQDMRATGKRSAHGRTAAVMLRVAPGVDPDTHQAIRTGQEDTKFGFNISNGSAEEAVMKLLSQPNLKLKGYHCHVGSQLMDSHAHVVGARRIAAFAAETESKTGPVEEVNVGGGLGVRYTAKDSPETFEEHCRQVAAEVRPILGDRVTIGFEPGRSLIAEAGTTLYRAGVIKRVPVDSEGGTRAYLSVDGGLSDNPRPQLYDAVYTAMNADRLHQEHDTPFRIVGKHCESDVLINDCLLPSGTEVGDLIAVQCTGAYNLAMSSNYNRLPRPALVMVTDEGPSLAVERETVEDLFRLEKRMTPSPLKGEGWGGGEVTIA